MTLTTNEAADLLGVSPNTIRSWVMRGQLCPVRRGAKPLMFREDDVTEAHFRMRPQAERDRLDALRTRFLASW